jgi:catechol 2,3-dioxygenase-like lactoylglutathione lyase family enzyme
MSVLSFRKLTPILEVVAIEPCLPFWEGLGFVKTVEVPHEDRLGFAILQREGVEVMLQTLDALRADDAGLAIDEPPRALLFFEVTGIEELIARAADFDVAVPDRTTFYGARELFVRDPAGNLIGFAEMGQAPPE